MAPTQEEWDALTPLEQAEVVRALPGEVTDAEMAPPEGDRHFKAKTGVLGALRGYFARQGRRVYLAAELPTYYPAEPRFAPDLLAVLDVESHDRDKWVVSAEGKGLDWVLEVHVGGDRKKDAERNVARYARLGFRSTSCTTVQGASFMPTGWPHPTLVCTPQSCLSTVATNPAFSGWTFKSSGIGYGFTPARRSCSRAKN